MGALCTLYMRQKINGGVDFDILGGRGYSAPGS